MFQMIPVFEVRWTDPHSAYTITARVSETELDSFLRTLRFNDVEEFVVVKEGRDPGRAYRNVTAGSTGGGPNE